jgi:hypothetical protein
LIPGERIRRTLRETLPSWVVIGRSVSGIPSNVELIRAKEGAAPAQQEM